VRVFDRHLQRRYGLGDCFCTDIQEDPRKRVAGLALMNEEIYYEREEIWPAIAMPKLPMLPDCDHDWRIHEVTYRDMQKFVARSRAVCKSGFLIGNIRLAISSVAPFLFNFAETMCLRCGRDQGLDENTVLEQDPFNKQKCGHGTSLNKCTLCSAVVCGLCTRGPPQLDIEEVKATEKIWKQHVTCIFTYVTNIVDGDVKFHVNEKVVSNAERVEWLMFEFGDEAADMHDLVPLAKLFKKFLGAQVTNNQHGVMLHLFHLMRRASSAEPDTIQEIRKISEIEPFEIQENFAQVFGIKVREPVQSRIPVCGKCQSQNIGRVCWGRGDFVDCLDCGASIGITTYAYHLRGASVELARPEIMIPLHVAYIDAKSSPSGKRQKC